MLDDIIFKNVITCKLKLLKYLYTSSRVSKTNYLQKLIYKIVGLLWFSQYIIKCVNERRSQRNL